MNRESFYTFQFYKGRYGKCEQESFYTFQEHLSQDKISVGTTNIFWKTKYYK